MTADDIDRAIATAFENFRLNNRGRNPTHLFITQAQEQTLRHATTFRFSVAGENTLDRQKYRGMDIIWTVRDGPAVGVLTTSI